MQVLVVNKGLGGCNKKGMAPLPQLTGREVSGPNVLGIGVWDWEKNLMVLLSQKSCGPCLFEGSN